MNCPACGYEFDPTRGLQCPRCGETLDCGSVSCRECDACSDVFGTIRRALARPDDE